MPDAFVVAFLKPLLDVRNINWQTGLMELEAVLPSVDKHLLDEADNGGNLNVDLALMKARHEVDKLYEAHPSGAVPLTNMEDWKLYTSYQNADTKQRLWAFVERVEIRCQVSSCVRGLCGLEASDPLPATRDAFLFQLHWPCLWFA